MRLLWNTLLKKLGDFARYMWNYTGTIAVLSLMLGVLGMGVYHLFVKEIGESYKKMRQERYYSGLYNSAGPEPPRGIGSLPVPGGDSCIHFEYTPEGLPARVVCIGADGNVRLLPGSRVAEQRVDYDDDGRVVTKSNFDAEGKPAADAHGVASRAFEYDEEGRLARTVTRDAAGKKVVPRMPGFAERQITYDDKDRPVEIRHLDGLGKTIRNAAGEHSVKYSYNDEHNVAIRSNVNNGSLCDDARGIAVERTEFSADGMVELKKWKNSQGHSVGADGAGSVLVEKSPSAGTRRVLRCGGNGMPLQNVRCCAEHLMKSDAQGRPEWECFNGADGRPCVNPELGYAEHVWEYDDNGNLTREYFWDAAGNPSPCYEKRYSGQGDAKYVISLHTDGATELKRCD